MIKLFLLKPDFNDNKFNKNQKYYCPHCAEIEGVIKYYPILKESIEIMYVDFKRPRQEIINLIGEDNQGCPNLIIDKNDFENDEVDISYFEQYGKYLFVNSTYSITEYLSKRFGIGIPHP